MTTTRAAYVRMHVCDIRKGDVLRAYEPWHVASLRMDGEVLHVSLYDEDGAVRSTAQLFSNDSVTIRAREATR